MTIHVMQWLVLAPSKLMMTQRPFYNIVLMLFAAAAPAFVRRTCPPCLWLQLITFEDISTAMYRIRDGIVRTQCKKSHFLSELTGCEWP